MDSRLLLQRLPEPVGVARRHGDVSGIRLDELERRLDREPLTFHRAAHGAWSAHSLSGELRAHGDTFAEVLDALLEQLEACP
jgi:hypothetical protein